MIVNKYKIVYGIPLTQEELVTLLMYFANVEGSTVRKFLIHSQDLRKVSVARIVSDTYHGPPHPPTASGHCYHSLLSQSQLLPQLSVDSDNYEDYTDVFTDFTDCLELDLEKYNCSIVVSWMSNVDTESCQQTPICSPREIPTVVIGTVVQQFMYNDHKLPQLTKIESVLPWTVSQLINAAFPHGTTALQMSTRCGLFLNVQRQ